MAFSPRPDGLNDLYLDDGTRVVSPLPAAQLQEMGHQPIPPMPQGPGLDPNALAMNTGYEGQIQGLLQQPQVQAPGMGPPAPPSVLDAPGGFKVIGDAPTVNGHARPDFQTGVKQIQAEAPQHDASAPKRKLVPLGAPGQQQGAGAQGGYGPQRVMKVKGGDVRASFTRTPGEEVPEDIKRDALSTAPEDIEINADSIATQREELRQKRELQIQDQQNMLDREAGRRAHVDATLAAKQGVVDQRDREIDRMKPQSASQVWEDKGTAARVLATISAGLVGGLNGYAAGLQGRAAGPNQVLASLNEAIGDEVAHQRATYDAAVARGETAKNDFAHAVALYGTPEAAALDLEMRHIGVAEKLLENRAGKIQDQEYLNNANQMAGELRQQRASVKIKLMELEKGKTLQENYVNVPDRYIGTGGAPKVKKDDGERQVRLPNGQTMFARDATRSRTLQEVVKANARLSGLAGRLKSLTDTVGKRDPTGAERAAADTIKSEMMFTYKDASQAGALDKGLQDAMEGYFGKATDIFRVEDVPRKLDEVRRIADSKVNEVVKYDLSPDVNYSPGAPVAPPHESDE